MAEPPFRGYVINTLWLTQRRAGFCKAHALLPRFSLSADLFVMSPQCAFEVVGLYRAGRYSAQPHVLLGRVLLFGVLTCHTAVPLSGRDHVFSTHTLGP